MISLATIKRESPLTIAREAIWRARKHWRSRRPQSLGERTPCPTAFRDVPYYSPHLDDLSDTNREIIVRVADQLCAGEFCTLGYDRARLGFPPAWNTDFVSGVTWEQSSQHDVVRVRFDGSDVKVPYELSRLQFLPILGKAHVLTRSDIYRQAAKELFSDWLRCNPVGVGVNWTLAMEAALRGMSVCFLLALLRPFRPDEEHWLSDVRTSLWHHLQFIETHIEFSHFIRSNHYLSNIVGLCCISAFLEGKPMAARLSRYKGLVEREILLQVRPDGCDYESSTGYHLLVTQMFTSHALLMRALCLRTSREFEARLRAMYRALADLADGDGRVPNAGDCDDGRVEWLTDDLKQMELPASDKYSLNISNQLGIGTALFDEDYGGAIADARWYGEIRSTRPHISARRRAPVFPHSGIAIARRGKAHLWFFNMPNGINGKGSHTHNDKLSVTLSLDGKELLCDSGTGVYTRDPAVRNRMRSTQAHNTVMVDQAEQNAYSLSKDRLFRMGDDARVTPIVCHRDDTHDLFRACHTGYARLGVSHTRTVSLSDNGLVIEDELRGDARRHDLCLFYHIPNSWNVMHTPGTTDQISFSIDGPEHVTLSVYAGLHLDATCDLVHISRTYGTLVPAKRLTISGSSVLPAVLRTEIRWGD